MRNKDWAYTIRGLRRCSQNLTQSNLRFLPLRSGGQSSHSVSDSCKAHLNVAEQLTWLYIMDCGLLLHRNIYWLWLSVLWDSDGSCLLLLPSCLRTCRVPQKSSIIVLDKSSILLILQSPRLNDRPQEYNTYISSIKKKVHQDRHSPLLPVVSREHELCLLVGNHAIALDFFLPCGAISFASHRQDRLC